MAAGLIALAAVLPALHHGVYNILHGISIVSLIGLCAGFFKASNETAKRILGAVFRVTWIIILPLVGAESLYFCAATDIFTINALPGVPLIMLIVLCLLVIAFVANTNRITLHSYYRDRLSETFIDVPQESDKDTVEQGAKKNGMSPDRLKMSMVNKFARGPYHIVNTTLNMPGSRNREVKGRKGVNFMFSREYCGSTATGFKKTDEYYSNKNTLTTAMAISGAAVSPQMGMYTNPLLRAILVLLNVRLNRWLPNPSNPDTRRRFVVRPYYFFKELLGLETEKDLHINLSDGGHLENGGICPLIMRGCRYIIASDAGEDPDFLMNDFAVSLRKIRIDFGVDIDIDLRGLFPRGDTKFTPLHYAVGTILYPDPTAQGYFVYLNSTLCGDEPEDLLSYGRTHPAFPDQSTVDQFFDEAQYESYRKLGELTGRQAFPEKGPVFDAAGILPDENPQSSTLKAVEIEKYFKSLYQEYKRTLAKLFP